MMDVALLLEWSVKSLLIIISLLTGFAYLTLFERRALARIQVRIGPNRAGPWGLLQPVADGIKLIFKEELIPAQADRALFILAPMLVVIPALILVAVVPLGPEVALFGRTFRLGLADDINVGVIYVMAVTSIAVYGIALAGWSSGNKYSLLGGLRAAAQMVSYELALGLAFVVPILLAGSMNLREIVEDQGSFVGWYIFRLPGLIAFLIFFLTSLAELNRAPFDLPEAEQELTAGYHTEYSGMKFALFYMGEYIKMIAISAIAASLFLGGYQGPGVDRLAWLGPLYLTAKVVAFLFGMIWIRATLPRFRYDRLMGFGWKILLPLGLLNVAAAAVYVVWTGG
jgi:NADH-quinone oxidoreductase subunit H